MVDRVVVAHEHNGDVDALGSSLLDKVQTRVDGDTVGKSHIVGGLDGRAVGNRVGEGDAELNHVGSSGLEALENGHGFFNRGESCGDEGNEGGTALLLALLESGSQMSRHFVAV